MDLVKQLAEEITEELALLLENDEQKTVKLNWLRNEYSRFMITSSDDYLDAANLNIRDGIWVELFKVLIPHLGKYGSTQAIFRAATELMIQEQNK